MMKLLSANFFTMLRTKRFWLGTVFMVGFGVLSVNDRWRAVGNGHRDITLDEAILSFAPVLFILLPIVCGLFINTDYHDGTIRNKIAVGRSRGSVYLSNLLIVWLVELFYTAVYTIVVLVGGIGIGFDNLPSVVTRSGLLLLAIAALAAIAAFFATVMTGRYALVICALLSVGLMFGSQIINGLLENPDTEPDVEDTQITVGEDGVMTPQYTDSQGNVYGPGDDIPMKPSPHYIDEPLRTVLRRYNQISPGGQLWEILQRGCVQWDKEAGELVIIEAPHWHLALWSLLVTAVFTAMGLVLFGRKDLK